MVTPQPIFIMSPSPPFQKASVKRQVVCRSEALQQYQRITETEGSLWALRPGTLQMTLTLPRVAPWEGRQAWGRATVRGNRRTESRREETMQGELERSELQHTSVPPQEQARECSYTVWNKGWPPAAPSPNSVSHLFL